MGHQDPEVITDLLQWLSICYSTTDKKLNVTRGHHHDYLGMNIDFSSKGTVKIDMIPYMGKILAAFPEKITGVSSSPAADLFNICPPIETQFLPEDQAHAFHHTTAQLLFLARVCRDIQTTAAFLTTRAKQHDEDDWGNLKSVLKYLCCTCSLPLTLLADSLTSIVWYVNASHQTHDDCKEHAGSILTFGRGATTSSSTKQKLPSKSSTESELIGLYDKSGNILWTHQFLEAQGYKITDNIVYQDNMSTLSLAKIGYVSSSKRIKHIKAQYFFICHYHDSGNLNLRYCPTEKMWADVLTKPLQGPRFRLMHAFLMNCPIDYSEDPQFVPSPLPTLAPITVSPKSHRSVKHPSVHPTDLLIKPQANAIMLSYRGCVEAKSQGTKVPYSEHTLVLEKSKLTDKKVSWWDTFFPHQDLYTCIHSSTHQRPNLQRVWLMVE
jgi:hypothetical protein